jgi:hypothetical protein
MIFKHPITYIKNNELENNVVSDLEFDQLKTDSSNNFLSIIINPKIKMGNISLLPNFSRYTTNKGYLKETQEILTSWKYKDLDINIYDKFLDKWKNIRNDKRFIERLFYIDIGYFKFLNHNERFLQVLSMYNLCSPILTLLIPICMLIIPLFILKLKGISITFTQYFNTLQMVLSKHALGNVFNIFKTLSWEKRVYGIISIVFYFFSVYQNTLSCIRFYNNFKNIHDDIFLIQNYITDTIDNVECFIEYIKDKSTYEDIKEEILEKKEQLNKLLLSINKISKFNVSLNKAKEIGYVMKLYYELHVLNDIDEIIEYTTGFNGFFDQYNQLSSLINNKTINKCKYKNGNLEFKKVFFPQILNNGEENINYVTNDVIIDKNIILTGPNASGKTTLLKSLLLNVILSQQIGFGFYENCKIQPYDVISCYINIPDTSDRDSLFQAEARRCRAIMNKNKNKNKRHFCIFDELFSGTNPLEATSSSYGFIKYLTDNNNFTFLLTTHLTKLCNLLDSVVENKHMKVNNDDEKFVYTYKIGSGLSNIKGGIKVLKDLEFPESIIKDSESILDKI